METGSCALDGKGVPDDLAMVEEWVVVAVVKELVGDDCGSDLSTHTRCL